MNRSITLLAMLALMSTHALAQQQPIELREDWRSQGAPGTNEPTLREDWRSPNAARTNEPTLREDWRGSDDQPVLKENWRN